MERKTGFEPATPTLARLCSTGLSYFRVQERGEIYRAPPPGAVKPVGPACRNACRSVTNTLMAILVQKYGGTSVNGPERIRAVARASPRRAPRATTWWWWSPPWATSTDELHRARAHGCRRRPTAARWTCCSRTGERVSMALLAMALARSRRRGDLVHRLAERHPDRRGARERAHRRDPARAHPRRARAPPRRDRRGLPGRLPRDPGDHHARAAAAPTPPRWRWPRRSRRRAARSTPTSPACSPPTRAWCPAARVIPSLSFRACSALAHLGGRVLHARCVDLAARERVPLTVRSSFDDAPGTRIVEDTVETPRVEAVAHRKDLSVVIAEGNAGGRGEARGILEAVAEAYPGLRADRARADVGHALGARVDRPRARTPTNCSCASASCAAPAASGRSPCSATPRSSRWSAAGSAPRRRRGPRRCSRRPACPCSPCARRPPRSSSASMPMFLEAAVRALHAAFLESSPGA